MTTDGAIDFDRLRHWRSLCHPMPARRKVLPFHRAFTTAEVAALQHGMLPGQMEDKWFGVLSEGALDFHRSWTGYHIYRLLLRTEGRGLVGYKLIVSRGQSQYTNTDDARDLECVAFLIDRMLRGQPA